MSGLNKAILIGNLGADPDVRKTQSGTTVVNLNLATSESWTDKESREKKEKTEWHRIVFFSASADTIAKYMRKGSKMYVEGQLQTRKWQDSDGNDRYRTEIVGRSFLFLSSTERSEPEQTQLSDQRPRPTTDLDADIPW